MDMYSVEQEFIEAAVQRSINEMSDVDTSDMHYGDDIANDDHDRYL